MSRVVTGIFDVEGTVLDVQAVTTKTGKLKYDVSFSDGQKYTTFLKPLAERAAAVKGLPGQVLRIEQSQNGQYTNNDLSDVNPANPAPGAFGNSTPAANGITPAQPAMSGITPAPSGITVAAPRDFEKETRGKVRHGAIIAGLEAAARTSQGESDEDLFGRAAKFAQAIEYFVFETGPFGPVGVQQPVAVEAPTPAPEPVTVEALVETGVVQVGTSGLPWGNQS